MQQWVGPAAYLTNSKIAANSQSYFSANEYALGDSAVTNSLVVVTCYKQSSGYKLLYQLDKVGSMIY